MTTISPIITKLYWGKIEIDGYTPFKDVKLFPGGAKAWNWQETGTQHYPGVQYSDVEDLVNMGAKVIILSRGVLGRLKIQPDTINKLESKGIMVHVIKTKKAVELYNELRQTEIAGALIHTTC